MRTRKPPSVRAPWPPYPRAMREQFYGPGQKIPYSGWGGGPGAITGREAISLLKLAKKVRKKRLGD